jgi:hypothetical protein
MPTDNSLQAAKRRKEKPMQAEIRENAAIKSLGL